MSVIKQQQKNSFKNYNKKKKQTLILSHYVLMFNTTKEGRKNKRIREGRVLFSMLQKKKIMKAHETNYELQEK